MVGHLDDQLQGQASQLHVHVDELDHLAESQRRGGRILRRGAGPGKACEETANPNFCSEYHAEEPAFWKRVYYWETPLAECGEGGENDCMDYNDWVQAWTEIKG